MLALGRQRVAKNATAVGRTLVRDILLEKMAPRAHLARAQLINKLIKLINEKKRRIEFGDLTRHGPKGQANYTGSITITSGMHF